jgi:hypothetical protein
MFVRKGWDVYVSDAVERGRSGFASPEVWPGEPIFLTYADPFERFRIGAGDGSWDPNPAKQKLMPGVQFPLDAYANYMKQMVPRWLSTDDAVIADLSGDHGLCREQEVPHRESGVQRQASRGQGTA